MQGDIIMIMLISDLSLPKQMNNILNKKAIEIPVLMGFLWSFLYIRQSKAFPLAKKIR